MSSGHWTLDTPDTPFVSINPGIRRYGPLPELHLSIYPVYLVGGRRRSLRSAAGILNSAYLTIFLSMSIILLELCFHIRKLFAMIPMKYALAIRGR